jgi:hypothetical protein
VLLRENELLGHIRLFKSEINALRSRLSLNCHSQNHRDESEREQRIVYLRQAFCGFFKAKNSVEMQHLGRVICAILGVSIEEQNSVLEAIGRLVPAVVATSTIESLSNQLSSIFS